MQDDSTAPPGSSPDGAFSFVYSGNKTRDLAHVPPEHYERVEEAWKLEAMRKYCEREKSGLR